MDSLCILQRIFWMVSNWFYVVSGFYPRKICLDIYWTVNIDLK